jgi:hypothetical protein
MKMIENSCVNFLFVKMKNLKHAGDGCFLYFGELLWLAEFCNNSQGEENI